MSNVNRTGLDFLFWECGIGWVGGSRQSRRLLVGGVGASAVIPTVCVLCVLALFCHRLSN